MAFRLRSRESVGDGLRRLARAQLKSTREHLQDGTSPGDEAIHEARKCIKKTRAIVQLCDADDASGLPGCRKRLRKINRELSQLRDAYSMLETWSALQRRVPLAKDRRAHNRIRRQLVSRKNAAVRRAVAADTWRMIDRECRKLRKAAGRWQLKHAGFAALASGIRESYDGGRKALARAKKTGCAADFHEWRKQVKTLWYELRLTEGASAPLDAHIATLERFEHWLGDDHNVVVLCERLSEETPALATVWRAGDRLQRSLRRRAIQSGTRAYQRSAKAFLRSVKRAWNAARERTQTHTSRTLASN
jgi:CHAD domain-containing protein